MYDASALHCSDFTTEAHAAHARLSASLCALRAARGVSEKLRRQWSHFEAELLTHLRAEEDLLLPTFGLFHHADAARVRSQHLAIRNLLVTIEQALAARQLDRQALASLQTQLDESGGFEERSLFPWAQQCLRPRQRGEFQQRTQRRASQHSRAKAPAR